jgi:hypothetical protein
MSVAHSGTPRDASLRHDQDTEECYAVGRNFWYVITRGLVFTQSGLNRRLMRDTSPEFARDFLWRMIQDEAWDVWASTR